MNDYKLVPTGATTEMLEAGEYAQYTGCYVSGIYADMLAEAPTISIVATKNEQGQIVSVTLQGEDHRILQVIAEADVQVEPVGRVKTIGGYPDESEHTVEWLCKYRDLKDGDLLYAAPQPAEQQPDITKLVEALESLMESESRGRVMPVGESWDQARAALAAYRKQGGEV